MTVITKYLTIITLLMLSFMGVLSLNLSMHMENSRMSNCLFMPVDSGNCQMSIADHLSKWQGMFFAIFDSSIILTLFTIFSSGIAYSVLRYFLVDPPFLYLYKLFKKENYILKLFDYFLQAISRGVIHSTTYA